MEAARRSGSRGSDDNSGSRKVRLSVLAGGLIGVIVLLAVAINATTGAVFAGLVVAAIVLGHSAVAGAILYPEKQTRRTPPSRRPSRRGRNAAVTYHRRYVVPELDLHGESKILWERAARAARTIRRSDAVRDGLIDTVEVSAVMPYHLWNIAERLALLSAPERRLSTIMRHLDETDPDVRAILEPQQRTRDLAVADVEQRVGRLEEFASLTVKADNARKRQQAIAELAALNPDYEELLYRLDDTENTLSTTGHPADELRAVVDDAGEAVRLANEAGRSLLLPDRDLSRTVPGFTPLPGDPRVGCSPGRRGRHRAGSSSTLTAPVRRESFTASTASPQRSSGKRCVMTGVRSKPSAMKSK